MKAIGFNLGQRGDLIMGTVAARSFKLLYPESSLTLGIGKEYIDMVDLFKFHPYIDRIHIYEGYADWPTAHDVDYLRREKYDIIFNGMPQHTCDNWFQFFHQTAETCYMHGLLPPDDLSCILIDHFKVIRCPKTVTFAPFAGFYNPNNTKKLSVDNAQKIVDILIRKGYTIVQLGGPGEPLLQNTIWESRPYVESVKEILKSDLYIGTDTGLTWVSSAYKHPTIGLYSSEYYKDKVSAIQPINPNAKYFSAPNVNNLNFEELFTNL